MVIALHIMPFWYFDAISPAWGHDPDAAAWHMSAWQWMCVYGERPVVDTLSALVQVNFYRSLSQVERSRRRAWRELVTAHAVSLG